VTWLVFGGLITGYFVSAFMSGHHRHTTRWHWALVGMCVALAGWTFMAMHSAWSGVIWLGFGAYWAVMLVRRNRSLDKGQPWTAS
jgi:hypothetical protein